MITERNAEAGRDQQDRKHGNMEPINTEIPEVQRHCSKRKNKRADQERARRPVNAVLRDAKNHLGNFVEGSY